MMLEMLWLIHIYMKVIELALFFLQMFITLHTKLSVICMVMVKNTGCNLLTMKFRASLICLIRIRKIRDCSVCHSNPTRLSLQKIVWLHDDINKRLFPIGLSLWKIVSMLGSLEKVHMWLKPTNQIIQTGKHSLRI
jgi:hypothetical protein